MKAKPENKTANKAAEKDFTVDSSLKSSNNNQPLFQNKIDKSNLILKKFGVPKFK